jgi:hypothetical protein
MELCTDKKALLYFFYCFISSIASFHLLLISFAGLRKEKTASVDSVGM